MISSVRNKERAVAQHRCTDGYVCADHPDRGWPHRRSCLLPIECPDPACFWVAFRRAVDEVQGRRVVRKESKAPTQPQAAGSPLPRMLRRAGWKWGDRRSAAEAEVMRKKQAASAAAEQQRKETAYRQWVRMVATDGAERVPAERLIESLSWQALEHVVAHLLGADGWQTELTNAGPDGGVDVIGKRQSRRLAAQVKHLGTRQGRIGRPVVQQLLGAATASGCTDAVLATSTDFTKGAQEMVRDLLAPTHIELWNRAELCRRINLLDQISFQAMVEPLIPELRDATVRHGL